MVFFDITFSEGQQYSMPYLHSHDYYELYFQLSGSRIYFCNNKYYSLSENALVATKPNTLHKFESGTFTHAENETFTRILIAASSEIFSPAQIEYLNLLDEKAIIMLSAESMQQIKDTLNELLKINASIDENKHLQIALKLGLLFHQIYKAQSGSVEPSQQLKNAPLDYAISPTILKIMDYLENNYNKNITLDKLCQLCNLSKTWICKSFLQANNMTIFEYKLKLQLNEAKKLLSNTKYSIDKISQKLGFSSPNYFCSIFKKNVGITPLRYRRKLRPTRK